ncbi:MAG: tripartite tricarboxylate transporter permease, partial [Desulfovibrio fairfieldensis]
MDTFLSALAAACGFEALLANLLGVALGIVFGALPGLTAVMGVALLIPLTFGLPPVVAFSSLLGMYCGAIYAGSITAILVSTPGTAAAAATMLEGPRLTARGESLRALEMTTVASFIGGVFSCFILAGVAPQLARFALNFSAPEYFALGIFGLTIVATLSEGALLKGCIAACLGLLIAMVGMDPLTGNLRLTFDSANLINGVSLIPALVGLYALSQVFLTCEDVFRGKRLSAVNISRKGISLAEIWANRSALLRGSLIGTFIGIVPATGSGTASFAAYSEAKRNSRHPEAFGNGAIEGLAATESANNAVTGGALIPLLTLGIPGDVVTAVILGALMIQGMTPGPLLFQ